MPINETVNIFARGLNQTLTLGFPLKESYNVTDVSTLRLKDGATTLAATFTVGSRWKGVPADTSKPIKWARVTFKDTGTPRTLVVDSSGTSVPAQTNPLVIANNANDFQISNGLLSLTINKQANAFDLITSAVFGAEVLHATNKPRLSVPVDKKTYTTWTNSPYDFAAIPTDSTIKVGNAAIYAVGETVNFEWEGTVQDYYPTGGADGHPFIIMATPYPILEMTRALMTTHRMNIIINPGGSQIVVPIDYSNSQGFCLLTAPAVTPTAGMKIRIQEVENEANKVIQSINAGANTLTFTTNFTQYMPSGVDVLPSVAATSTAAMALTGATLEKQYGDKRVIVKQSGVLKDVNNGTQIEQTLKFEVRHDIRADCGFVISGITIRNHQDVPTDPECPSVYFRALNFDLPTAVAGTAASDSVVDNTLATTRYKANNYHSTLNHGGIANFQWSVFQFNLEFPNTIAVDSAGCHFSIFPESAGPTEFEGSAIKTRYVIWGLNAANGLPLVSNLAATLDSAYVAATKAVRPNIVEKRNWNTIFASDSQRLRDAATRYERMAGSPYDLTVCEAVSGARPAMTLKEYRWEYPERAGANTIFGWNKFGNVNEDVGFGNNRYDLPYILFREGLREATQANALKAFELGFQQIRNRMELGQYWSHKNFNNIAGLDLHGLARYERAYAPDPFNYTNQLAPTHSWNEGTCLYWALTDDPIAEEAAKAGAAQAARYNYQGTYGARLFGTGAYQMKDPGTGLGSAEPRYVAWPILNLVVGYRYFGEADWLTKAIEYARCFIVTMAGEAQQDGFIDFISDGGTIQPLFQHGGYCMHGIIEAWREATGQDQTDLATYIGKVANFLYKGDQQASNVTANSPLLANGVAHPNDNTKYNPAIYFPFSYKRSFAGALTAAVNTTQTTIPVDDTSTFLLANNGNYGNPAPDAVGILITDLNNPATWEYFRYTGRSTTSGPGNLTGVTRAFGASGAKSFAQGAIVYPLGLGGALNDIVVATLIAGARVTGTQQLQDFAEKIWIDNCLYRDEYTTDNPAFVTAGTYSPINFWPKNVGPNAPKLTAQSLTALSEFLGDRVTPQPIPTISSISPTVIAVGSGNTTITVNGSNYDGNAIVRLGATNLTTTFVSATQLTAVIPSGDLVAPATLSITVRNPNSGNTSGAVSLPVAHRPTISSLFPDSKVAGDPAFVLIVNGTNFESNSTVTINGVSRTTTYVNATRLDVQVLAGDVATAGNKPVIVTNPSSGLASTATQLTVAASASNVPVLSGVSPNTQVAGHGATMTPTLSGTGFQSGVTIRVNGNVRNSVFISATTVFFEILVADLVTPGTLYITAENPSPNTGLSNSIPFTVTAPPAPTITGLSPNAATVNVATGALTITGTNLTGATVTVDGNAVTPTSNTATQIVLPSQTFAATGAKAIVVTTANGTVNTSISVGNPAPALTGIAPTSATAGASDTTITLTGTNFTAASVARAGATSLATAYVSPTQLTATIPAGLLLAAGSLAITVFTAAPGGGTSAAQTFTINPAAPGAPTLTSVSPTTATLGVTTGAILLTGTNLSTATVTIDGVAVTPTSNSATQIALPAQTFNSTGTKTITIATAGGSAFTTISVGNPVPGLNSIAPTNAAAGDPQLSLTVTGNNFVNGSIVRWNGTALATTFLSATQLSAVVPASLLLAAGSVNVTVFTATPGGGTTSAVVFTINAPAPEAAPVLTTLNPNNANAGGAQFTLTLTGTGFQSGALVRVNGQARATIFVSPTQLSATIPAGDISTVGTRAITVLNPDDQISNALTLPINAINPPVIESLSPALVSPGSPSFVLAVIGQHFAENSQIQVDGTPRTTAWISVNRLETIIGANEVLAAGTLAISVTTAGVGTSASVSLPVQQFVLTLPKLTPEYQAERMTLRIEQGKSFQATIPVSVDGIGADLTGVTAVLQMRRKSADEERGAAPLMSLTTANGGLQLDLDDSLIIVNLTPVQTQAFKFARCRFEVEATTPEGIVVGIAKGDIVIRQEVVR